MWGKQKQTTNNRIDVLMSQCCRSSSCNIAAASGVPFVGLVHPESRGHHAEHREHHRGAGLHIPAAGPHGQGAGGDHPEVSERRKDQTGGKSCL